ncbi:NAD(P)H-binding protein [Streptomyces sp. NPDC014623]|uniref:NAD(P)H-binding protein n=1 Tax=Streptomyces sp. NPDC014623 TaxID=3364875 RepID=UPI0036F7966B
MKILVVGASGLLGQHTVTQLQRRGHMTTALARTDRPGIDHALDVSAASVGDWREVLAGHDGVVFAAGLDDRRPLRRPAYPTLRRANVEPVVALLTAARQEGLTRAAVIGSYFTCIHRRHPTWHLAIRHPYIRSRIEQAREGRAAAGPNLPVAVLEVPFVFGAAIGRRPDWCRPLESWARSRWPLYAPDGSTAVTSARHVAEVAVAALEHASGEDLPVVEDNLSWQDMIARVASAVHRARPVRRLPSALLRTALHLAGSLESLTGHQSGLTLAHLPDLLLRDLHLDPGPAAGLGLPGRPKLLDTAITESLGR